MDISAKIEMVRAKAEEISRRDTTMQWFVVNHIEKVVEKANWLLDRLSDANREVVILMVWLHDIAHILDLKEEKPHTVFGAMIAQNLMEEVDMPKDILEMVIDGVKRHSCKKGHLPQTLEAKILATADAMSHFTPEFFISIAMDSNAKRTIPEFILWAKDKLEKDFNGEKIFFDFAREAAYEDYIKIKTFFEI